MRRSRTSLASGCAAADDTAAWRPRLPQCRRTLIRRRTTGPVIRGHTAARHQSEVAPRGAVVRIRVDAASSARSGLSRTRRPRSGPLRASGTGSAVRRPRQAVDQPGARQPTGRPPGDRTTRGQPRACSDRCSGSRWRPDVRRPVDVDHRAGCLARVGPVDTSRRSAPGPSGGGRDRFPGVPAHSTQDAPAAPGRALHRQNASTFRRSPRAHNLRDVATVRPGCCEDVEHGEDDPDHRCQQRTRRGDGPAVRAPRARPRALRPAYRPARGAEGRGARRSTPTGGSRSGRST